MKISREYIKRVGKNNSHVNNPNGRSSKAVHADEADNVPWTGVQNVITGSPSSNEFNICDTTPSNNRMWFNYGSRKSGQLSSPITEYVFGNGMGSRSGVTVKAENFFADSAVSVVSDERKKIVSKEMVLDLDKIANAPSVLFKWKDKHEEAEHVGTIAQYWQEVMPHVVCEDHEGNLSMQYGTAALVAVISVARELREIKKLLKDHGIF